MLPPWVLGLILTAWAAPPPEAERLARAGRVEEAAASAKAAVDAHPDDLAAQELYVDLLLSLGMVPRAVEHAEARVKAVPHLADAWYLLGRALPDAERSKAAYETALRADPTHGRAHMGMGALYEVTGRLADAEAAYGRAVKEDPSLAEAWGGAVRCAVRAGRSADALALAERAVAAVPGDPSLVLQLASLAPDRALALLDAAAPGADDPRLYSARAELLLQAGRSAEALEDARAALSRNPADAAAGRVELFASELAEKRIDDHGLRTLLALRGVERDAPAQALPQYGPLVAKYPRSALVLLGRASLRERTGDRAGSLKDLLAASELDLDNTEVAAAAGLALLDADRPGEAEPLLSAASLARPWDRSLVLARWKALVQIGRALDALQVVEPAALAYRLDPAVQAAYAGTLAELGRSEDAYRVAKTALILVPDPRLVATFVQVAPAAGHREEAAALLDQIVAHSGNAALAEAARKLRAP